jgi:hypothetical protein
LITIGAFFKSSLKKVLFLNWGQNSRKKPHPRVNWPDFRFYQTWEEVQEATYILMGPDSRVFQIEGPKNYFCLRHTFSEIRGAAAGSHPPKFA